MKNLEIFENKLRNANYSKRTTDIYLSYLKMFFIEENIKDPYQVTFKKVVKYLENKNYTSVAQQNQIIGSLKLFCKYILNKKDIHLRKIERPKGEKKLPKVIDKEFLLEKINNITNLKHKSIISLGYSVGLRVSEILNLKIEDIDSKRMIIHIKNAKGRKDRIVPLSENILVLLREYYIHYNPKTYLFNGQNKLQYSETSCNKIIKKYISKDAHMHLLRHSCFTNLVESGVDIRIIQKLAGHKNIKTTEIYTHISNEILSKIKLPI